MFYLFGYGDDDAVRLRDLKMSYENGYFCTVAFFVIAVLDTERGEEERVDFTITFFSLVCFSVIDFSGRRIAAIFAYRKPLKMDNRGPRWYLI